MVGRFAERQPKLIVPDQRPSPIVEHHAVAQGTVARMVETGAEDMAIDYPGLFGVGTAGYPDFRST